MIEAINRIIVEREKQVKQGKTPESDKEYNGDRQLAVFMRLLLHTTVEKNPAFERILRLEIEMEKSINPSFKYTEESLLKYMTLPYEKRVVIVGALCVAELERLS